MDIFAHSLWSGFIFRKQKKIFWPIFFGIAPDIFSFGVYLFAFLILNGTLPFNNATDHQYTNIPQYTNFLYGVTHSFVIFAIVFLIVWFVKKKPYWPLLAWGIHIAIDVPLHSAEFFPTPFLFPVSAYRLEGVSWNNTYIFLGNYLILGFLYFSTFVIKSKRKKITTYLFEKRKIVKR